MRLSILEITGENLLTRRNYRRNHQVWQEVIAQDGDCSDEADFICFLGHPEKTVVYEIALPGRLRRTMERVVLFGELAARLPVSPESVHWFYRSCGDGLYLVCAVHGEEMDRLFGLADARRMKFDLLVPAKLAEKPEELLQVIPGKGVPERFRPVRCRRLKSLYLVLLLSCIGFLGAVVCSRYLDFAGEKERLREIGVLRENELREERRRFGELSAERETLAELRSAKVDTPPVSPVLSRLSSELPATMWLTSYAQNYDTADLTLSASKDEPGLYNLIGENESYAIVNLRKSRGVNDTISFFIKLRIKQR